MSMLIIQVCCQINLQSKNTDSTHSFSVVAECKKNGLSPTNQNISKAVKDAMDFFGVAKSVDGRSAAKTKSLNVMGRASWKRDLTGKRSSSPFWSLVKDFEAERVKLTALIVSCEERNAESCVKGIDRPFLIISAEDINSKNFSKHLGKTMMEPTYYLCIETVGLDEDGSERLARFMRYIRDMFDNRCCVVLCAPKEVSGDVAIYSEKHFELDNHSIEKKEKVEPDSKLEQTLERLQQVQEEASKLKKENFMLAKEVSAKEMKINDMKTKIEDLENASAKENALKNESVDNQIKWKENNDELEENLRKKTAECASIKTKLRETLSTLEASEKENFSLKVKIGDTENNARKVKYEFKLEAAKQSEVINELRFKCTCLKKESQKPEKEIDSLKVSDPNDSVLEKNISLLIIKERLVKNNAKSSSAVNLVVRSIKDLKYSVSFSEVGDITHCAVAINNGKIIMNYPGLLNFVGEGNDKENSKCNAFANFILAVNDHVD